MPLIDYRTTFTKLKYGRDRFGETGDSNSSKQPYIKSSIPDEYLGTTGGPDFLLRGGTLVPKVVGQDVSRLTKLLFGRGNAKGPLFIAKQNVLSLTNVNSGAGIKAFDFEKKSGIAGFFQNLGQKIADIVPLNQGIYSPINTIASTLAAPTGVKLVKQGFNPILATNPDNPFSFGSNPDTNQPLALPTYLRTMFPNGNTLEPTNTRLVSLASNATEAGSLGTPFLKYSGGPNALMGIGSTQMTVTAQNRTILPEASTTIANSNIAVDSLSQRKYNSGILNGIQRLVLTYREILEFGDANAATKTGITSVTPNFQKVIAPTGNASIPNTLNYVSQNFQKRVNLGDPGIKGNLISYTIGKRFGDINATTGNDSVSAVSKKLNSPSIIDKINRYPIYKSEGPKTTEPLLNDFVKFRIGVISNDNPKEKTYIHFRAIIDDFSDSYSADWETTNFMGRGESFAKYKGFDRSINLSWTVAAQSKGELIPMYQKLNYLASVCAPDYSDSGYMRGNLITLTVGGWCYELPGYMSGISLDVPQEAPWELALPDGAGLDTTGANKKTDPSVKEMPMMIKVTGFKFTPIHRFVPTIQKNEYDEKTNLIKSYGDQKYLQLKASSGDNYNDNTNKNINYIPD
tara:strand:+ start:592 stop:2478 length:1887 start_codon:yes stop_codon:yes gene_type:complete